MLELQRSLLALLALVLGAVSCASGSSSRPPAPDGLARRVTLYDYAVGRHFELVGESHTARVEYYSQKRSDAARKVQTDEVMAALLEKLGDEGFVRFAQAGRAPSQGGQLITRALEVQSDDGVRHWAVGKGSNPEERIAFNACMSPFLELYNLSQSFQAIENSEGSEYFDKAQAPGRNSRP